MARMPSWMGTGTGHVKFDKMKLQKLSYGYASVCLPKSCPDFSRLDIFLASALLGAHVVCVRNTRNEINSQQQFVVRLSTDGYDKLYSPVANGYTWRTPLAVMVITTESPMNDTF
jgi:hypothetical protein